MSKLFIFIGCLLLLSACEDVKTVEYWRQHKVERKLFLKQCANGDIDRNSQSCENARIAKEWND